MMSLKLIFSKNILKQYKNNFIGRERASVSAIVSELGSNYNKHYQMRDMIFWMLHKALKIK